MLLFGDLAEHAVARRARVAASAHLRTESGRGHVREPQGERERAIVVLGHLVRGGNPSFLDRMVAARLAFAATTALLEGATDEMVAWQSPLPGGVTTSDASVKRFALGAVLEETQHLLDGTSPVTQRRVGLMSKVEGVLQL